MSDPNVSRDPTTDKAQIDGQFKPRPPDRRTGRRQLETKAAALRQLQAKVEPLQLLIVDSLVYIDTIKVSTAAPVPPAIRQKLRKVNNGEIYYKEGKRWRWRGRDLQMRPYLIIHQPTPDTIKLVERFRHKISRVDAALDLITRSQADADKLKEDLLAIVTQRWRRPHWAMEDFQTTTYYRHRPRRAQTRGHRPARDDETTATGCDLVLYSKPSKLTGQPAAHLELRTFSAQACRRRRIHRAADLVEFDLRSCFRRGIRFSAVRWGRAAALLEEEADKYARHYRARCRQQSRRPLPAFGPVPLRHRLVRMIATQLIHICDDYDELPTWNDFANFPVQKIFDAAWFLRGAAVHIPADSIIDSRPHVI